MPIAIVDAKIHTMAQTALWKRVRSSSATVESPRSEAISGVFANAQIIDAAGKVVTPGMFDPYSQIGVVEISLIRDTVDGIQSLERYSASFEVAESINPRSTLIRSIGSKV